MKLLLCMQCDDIFNLGFEVKTCKCGITKGKYTDDRNAIYTGTEAIPLGFDNYTFSEAIINQSVDKKLGERYTAFVIPKKCDTFVKVDKI